MPVFVECGGALCKLADLTDADALTALQGYDRLHVVGPDPNGGLIHVAAQDRWRHQGQDRSAPDVIRDDRGRRWAVPGGKSNPHPKGGIAAWIRA